MKLIALALSLMFLVGCTRDTVYVDRPVEVLVPVPVPCITTMPAEPEWAMDAEGLSSKGLFAMGLAALQEVEQRRQHKRETDAIMLACMQ